MEKSLVIPQDIIDNIIAAVGDDKRLLKKCALVSSSFLLPRRKQLFSTISIGSEQSCQRIYQVLVQNPAIQSFVITIALSEANVVPEWMNCTSLLAILGIPFCFLECFSITACRDEWLWYLWGWDDFSSEMKDALLNIIRTPTLKTLSLTGILNVPTTFFCRIVHLTTLELDSLSPNDFGSEDSSSLTRAASSIVHLTTLELHSLSPNDFGGKDSSSLTRREWHQSLLTQ